jgi:ketosteroid isomerase-like protein
MQTNFLATPGSPARSAPAEGAFSGEAGGNIPAGIRQQIATIPEAYVERALAGDWDGVAQLYHEEAIQLLPDAPPVKGRDAILGVLSLLFGADGGVRLTSFSVEIDAAEMLGEAVYVQANYQLELELLGEGQGSVRQHGAYVNILRRDAQGDWRIWRQFVNRAHPPHGPAAE